MYVKENNICYLMFQKFDSTAKMLCTSVEAVDYIKMH